MPVDWVVWSILVAAKFRLAEVGVPPGSATIEKLAALVPGSTDRLLSRAMTYARKRSSRGAGRTGGA
jgi:hypothetical protein